MDFSYLQDDRWQDLDQTQQDQMISLAFEREVASDPRWNDLTASDQEAMFQGYQTQAQQAIPEPEPEPAPGIFKTIGKGLAHGALGLVESVGTGTEYLGQRVGSETLKEVGQATKGVYGKFAQEYRPTAAIEGKNVWDNPELLKNAEYWLYNVSDMVPMLAASIIPGVGATKALSLAGAAPKLAAIGGSIVGGGFGGALEGTQTYNAVLARGGTEPEAARSSELMTLISGILNALSIGKVLSKAGSGFKAKVIKTGGAAAWEGLTEGLEEPAEVFSKYFGSYLAGEPLPTDLEAQLIDSAKAALTVAPIAAITGGGGSIVSDLTYQPPETIQTAPTVTDAIAAAEEEIDSILKSPEFIDTEADQFGDYMQAELARQPIVMPRVTPKVPVETGGFVGEVKHDPQVKPIVTPKVPVQTTPIEPVVPINPPDVPLTEPGQAFGESEGLTLPEPVEPTAPIIPVEKKETLVEPSKEVVPEPIVETPIEPDVPVVDPVQLVADLNKELPGNDIKYDGEFDRSALKKDPLYTFTPQSGELQGRTFVVEELTPEAIKAKMAEMQPTKEEAEVKVAPAETASELDIPVVEQAPIEEELFPHERESIYDLISSREENLQSLETPNEADQAMITKLVDWQKSIKAGTATDADLQTWQTEAMQDILRAQKDQSVRTPQFQAGERAPGEGVKLKDIQAQFPKQKVFIGPNKEVSVIFDNGQGIIITHIKDFDSGDKEIAFTSGQMGSDGIILGGTEDNKITLSKDYADAETLAHETKHVLSNLGILTSKDDQTLLLELNRLLQSGKFRYDRSSMKDPEDAREEDLANVLAQVLTDRKLYRGTRIGKIIQKITDFFDSLMARRKQTTGKLAKEIESGKIFSRTPEGKVAKSSQRSTMQPAPKWYSALIKSIEAIKQPNAPAPAWKSMINKLPIKKEEIEWTGINEWLDKKGGKVSKQEILDFIASNNVELEEVIKEQEKTEMDNIWEGEETSVVFATSSDKVSAQPFDVPEVSTKRATANYAIIDVLAPFVKTQKAISEEPLDESQDYVLSERLRRNKQGAQITKAKKELAQPIVDLMTENNYKLTDVDDALYGQHAIEANKRLRLTNARRFLLELADTHEKDYLKDKIDEIDQIMQSKEIKELGLPNSETQKLYLKLLKKELQYTVSNDTKKIKAEWNRKSEKFSGITDTEAAEINDKWASEEDMQKILKLTKKITKATLDVSLESGRITQEEYDAFNNTFKHYIPLQREGHTAQSGIFGTGQGIVNLGKDYKIRGGSEAKAVNMFSNALIQHEQAIRRAGKAETGRTFLELVKANPNKDFWNISEKTLVNAYDAHGNIYKKDDYKIEENDIPLKLDGKYYIISMNQDNEHAMRIAKHLKGTDAQTGWLVRGLSKFNRMLATVYTGLNPEFIITNPVRDIQIAAVNLSSTEIKDMTMKVMKDLPKAAAGLQDAIRGDATSDWGKIAKEAEEDGMLMSWAEQGQDVEKLAKSINREVMIQQKNPKANVARTTMKIGQLIKDYNMIAENMTRLAAYKNARDAGISRAKSALLGKELTVNFEQKGLYGEIYNSLYLFSSAGVQGSTRLMKGLVKSSKARKMVGGMMISAMGVAITNGLFGGDDKEEKNNYNNVSDYDKERNMIFIVPNSDGKIIKIPLGWGLNFFWNIGTELGDLVLSKLDPKNFKYDPLEGASRLTKIGLDAFNPIQSSTLLQTISPTISDPIVQVGENKTFSGSPLMPEKNKFEDVETPESQRYWKTVRPISKITAEWLNSITGGDKVEKGKIDVSPEVLDLIFDTYTGGLGKFVEGVVGLPKALGEDEINLRKIPVARKFIGTTNKNKGQQDFYSNAKEVKMLLKKIKTYPERRREFMKDPRFRLKESLFNTERQVNALRKILKKVKSEKSKKRLNDRIKKLQNKFNDRFDKRINK